MILLVIRLLILAIILYAIVYVIMSFKKITQSVRNATAPREACPACRKPIQVSGEEMECPECGVQLARNKDGKLLIKVN